MLPYDMKIMIHCTSLSTVQGDKTQTRFNQIIARIIRSFRSTSRPTNRLVINPYEFLFNTQHETPRESEQLQTAVGGVKLNSNQTFYAHRNIKPEFPSRNEI